MAEFQEVMKQYHRMCQSYKNCEGCPMYMRGFCTDLMSVDIRSTEQVIMNWAEEHPEPVYPTWNEWFETFDEGIDVDEPIPADIAQKLGLEPKCE